MSATVLAGLLALVGGWAHVTSSSGAAVHWEVGEVGLALADDLPADWKASEIESLVEAAALAWSGVSCADGATALPQLRFDSWTDSPTLDAYDGVQTVLWVHQGWDYGSKLLALTTLEYDPDTGELSDADVEVNVGGKGFDVGKECGADALHYDLLATLTHEFGHVLGLEHSASPVATMFEATNPGECLKRTVSQDDREGLCALYAPSDGPESSVEAVEPAIVGDDPGCAGGKDTGGGRPLVALILAWLLAARLVRSRERHHLTR